MIALGDHRQRCLGVRTEEHLLLGEGVDRAQVPDRTRLEVHGAFQDLPVHAGFALPDFDGLFLSELIAQAMPRSSASVGHGFDEMSHLDDSFGCKSA